MSFCKLSGSAQAPGFSRWKPCLMGAPIAAGKMRVLPSDFLALLNSVSWLPVTNILSSPEWGFPLRSHCCDPAWSFPYQDCPACYLSRGLKMMFNFHNHSRRLLWGVIHRTANSWTSTNWIPCMLAYLPLTAPRSLPWCSVGAEAGFISSPSLSSFPLPEASSPRAVCGVGSPPLLTEAISFKCQTSSNVHGTVSR